MPSGAIPREVEVYGEVLGPSVIRLLPLCIGVVVLTIPITEIPTHPWWVTAMGLLFWPWNAYDAMTCYFAAIPPYTGIPASATPRKPATGHLDLRRHRWGAIYEVR